MKVLEKKEELCFCCMEEHEVKTVLVRDKVTFKGVKVVYDASYKYCDKAEELYADEYQMRENDMRLKDAYRKEEGLLTAGEICAIRRKYTITQKDLCILLGWGEKTITRYEGHQVQDKAHDTILRKLDRDPEWFLLLLNDARRSLPDETFQNYYQAATKLYEANQDSYLRKSIEARYARFQGESLLCGNTELNLDKVVDVIRFFAASTKIINLFKVKLMKLMWFADALSYKIRGHAITGLVYQALPMGAVPVEHNSIINLSRIPCEEVDIGETNAYYFSLKGEKKYPSLSDEDKRILRVVIDKLGMMTKDEIVAFMHKEEAYIKTEPREMISYKYAKNLQFSDNR